MNRGSFLARNRHMGACACALGLLLVSAHGQEPAAAVRKPELAEGRRYVAGLRKLGLPEIANEVLQDLKRRFPEAGPAFKIDELDGVLSVGDFEKGKAIIAAEPSPDSPEVWGMKLSMAGWLFTYNRIAEAKGLYEAFFKRYPQPPPELADFFMESAYMYAQRLLYIKEEAGALDVYRRLLNSKLKLPAHLERQCLTEMSELAVKLAIDAAKPAEKDALLKEADAWADKLLWAQDIWFGKAIVIKAHIVMLKGKPDAAKKLVEDYMPTLQTIHEALVKQEKETGEPLTRISPMAECRYLLAVMLQDEANRLMKQPGYNREEVLSLLLGARDPSGKGRLGNGAFNHFINVFIRYPESTWAAEAGERSEQIRELLATEFGGDVKTPVTPEQMAKVRRLQFQDARLLFSQGQFANAIPRYRMLLNRFPESPEAVQALGEYARCYIQSLADDPLNELYADTVIAHLSERFCRNRETSALAGNEVVRLAEYWTELNREDKRRETYDLFFAHYPAHPMTPNYLASFGERHYKEKDYATALRYFQRVADVYTNAPLALDALSRIATIHREIGDTTNEVAALEQYVQRLTDVPKPGQALMSSRYRLAQAYKDSGMLLLRSGSTNAAVQAAGNTWIGRAALAYDKLAEILKQPDHPYQANEAEKKQNAELLEAALFNTAYCLSQVTQPAEKVPAIRQKAISSYEELVKTFPKSQFAPAALIQIGSMWTVLRDTTKAEAALSRLLKEYPDSDQARSALPILARNLLELGMREEALRIYRQMFSDPGAKYSDSDMLLAAQELVKARETDLARQGFDAVIAKSKDVALVAPARLGLARVLMNEKKFPEAVSQLQGFVKEYPAISLMVDANQLLCQAASLAGEQEGDDEKRKEFFNAAIDAMKEIRRRRTTPAEQAEADVEMGRIMARKARAEMAFGKPDKAHDSRGKALVSYQLLIMNTDPGNVALAPVLEMAYAECIPLLMEHKLWDTAAENSRAYLAAFPHGRFVADVRTWMTQADLENGGQQQPPAPPAPEAAPEAPKAAAVTP